MIRLTLDARGVVQGIGFRPTLHRLARTAGLGGWVQNRTGTVRLVLDGPAAEVDAFVRALPARLPTQARLDALTEISREPLPSEFTPVPFVIRESSDAEARHVTIPADLAMCPDCRGETFDPANRRYRYPFTTCTACGPRYTVVTGLPYDRERTTLAAFPLCADCRREYSDPDGRRFHAESIACPACGPRLTLLGADGQTIPGDPLREARRLLAEGALVAVRGLGGFLLAADVRNRAALARLRARKRRPHKPVAVMAADVAAIRRLCELPPAAETLLTSPRAPVVILPVRPETAARWPLDLLSPDAPTLGIMLPTTPLHALLLAPTGDDPTPAFDGLVMTSGNRRSEPICLTLDEACERLAGIADAFLTHDREIELRNDDSVCAWNDGAPQVWRRARGHAPDPVFLARPLRRVALACGPDLKNTIALGMENEVVLSSHIGDLETPEALEGWRRVAEMLPRFLARDPEVVAVDLHPDFHSTRLGRALAQRVGLPVVAVQHHHAHAAAALAEHGVDEALALVFDGVGYGTDGTVWGAELLRTHPGGVERLGTFAPAPLLGGDAAVRDPRRQLFARLWSATGGQTGFSKGWKTRLRLTGEEIELWAAQLCAAVQCPAAHSAGRLFDAVAAALGLCREPVTYEGQAAIRLETLAGKAGRGDPLPPCPPRAIETGGLLHLDWSPWFARWAESPPAPETIAEQARAFHDDLARAALTLADYGRTRTGLATIALTGGVFMNRRLTADVRSRLEAAGWRALVHHRIPPNDGGVALGQAVIAGSQA